MGDWLIVFPSTVNGICRGDPEWRNTLFLSYGIDPPDLPPHCNGYNSSFSIGHSLDCKKGILITTRYNKICDGVSDLDVKYFTPSHLHNDPLIDPGR